MSYEAVERFLGRLITDDSFQHFSDGLPTDACLKKGGLLSAEELWTMLTDVATIVKKRRI